MDVCACVWVGACMQIDAHPLGLELQEDCEMLEAKSGSSARAGRAPHPKPSQANLFKCGNLPSNEAGVWVNMQLYKKLD